MAEHCSADRYFLFVTFLVVAENYCLSTFKRRKVPSLSIPCCHLLTEGMFYCTCPPDTFDHPHARKKNPFWNRHPLLNLISESTSRSTSTAEAVNTSNVYFVISCCVQEISSQPVQILWRYFCVDESGGLTSKRWCCFSSKNKDCIFFPFYNTSAPFFEVISCKSRFYLSYSLAF